MTDPKPITFRSISDQSVTIAEPSVAGGLAVLLRVLRSTRGLTQEGLAAHLAVSTVTVRRWEMGQAAPTAEVEAALDAWCRAHHLYRRYDTSPLQGIDVTPELLRDVVARARSEVRRRPGAAAEPPSLLHRLTQVTPAPALAGVPATPASTRMPNHLPNPPTRLIGRRVELARLCGLLLERGPGVLTLTGTGGVGKTRLALAAAHELHADFPGGVYFVALEALNTAEQVLPAIAAALHLTEQGSVPLLDVIVRSLQGKPALIVLDTFEHLVAAAPHVIAVCAGASQVTFLITSRAPLRIPGEREFALAPLVGPSASDLFVERARDVVPDLPLTERDRAVVAEICSQLDGLPLAIELAAVWAKVLPLPELGQRLTVAVSRPAVQPAARPDRQQTLTATIAWSHDLLSEREQVVFRRLAGFAGGWTLAAAETICADTSIEPVEILPLLARLVDQSLVIAEPHREEPRYRMLDTIRDFAVAKLEGSGEAHAVRSRHRAWFLAKAEAEGRNHQAGMLAIAADHDNMRAALLWRADDAGDAELRLRMVTALWRFWQLHGHLVEGRRWLETVLADSADAAPDLRARALNGLGTIAYYQGDLDAAQRHYREALAGLQHSGDQRGVMSLLNNLALAAYFRGNRTDAFGWWEEALNLARRLDDRRGIAEALGGVSLKALDAGDRDQSRQMLAESHALLQELGDARWVGTTMVNNAVLAYFQGDFHAALRFTADAATLGRRQANTRIVAVALRYFGMSHCRLGAFEPAREPLYEALELFRAIGDELGVSVTLEAIAALAVGTGRQITAVRLLAAAAHLRTQRKLSLTTSMQADTDHIARLVRAAVTDATLWSHAWAEGETWSLEAVLDGARTA